MKSELIGALLILLINAAYTGAYHVFGDMILSNEQYDEMSFASHNEGHAEIDNGRRRRNAIRGRKYRWRDGIIPYSFDNSFSNKDRNKIEMAMNIWEKYTCLSFRPRRHSDLDYVHFINGSRCGSPVGRVGSRQPIFLLRNNITDCRNIATILHEIGHTIGMYHTHTRMDRDRHIKLYLSGVHKSLKHNFKRLTNGNSNRHGVKYDFHSIMHYEPMVFGGFIQTKKCEYQNHIGAGVRPSFGDIEMVNKMYKCKPKSCQLNEEADCPPISFVGSSCTCICPGPENDLDNLTQPCPIERDEETRDIRQTKIPVHVDYHSDY